MSPWCETWGFDLRTAEGYQAWRDAGGRWPDETPERMRAYCEAGEAAVAVVAMQSESEAA
jgi:hypothetical protein